MDTHEYQAKEVLKRYGIPIPEFAVATKVGEVEKAIRHLQLKEGVVKIQVHAGGRGKAGGVKFGKTPEEIIRAAEQLIGMKMVNNQTGPEGIIAHEVLITKPIDIKKEYYLGAVIDRERAVPILIASPEGGMEIEEVAEKHPDKILKLPIELDGTLRGYRQVRLCSFMGWHGEMAKEGARIARGLAKAFIETDASLLEINPFVESTDGKLWALDAKLSVDDNALYRQPDISAYYDPTQVSANEVAAKEFELAYIALDGNIGCMVNGAGLAMATMDIIQYYGGKPANFLDVGGGASKEKVAEAFKIILSDPKVKAILVNIFGGIMNCATLAEGIIAAASEMEIKVPLVVRMEGTNVEEGKKMLQKSNLSIVTADGLAEAAEKVCATLKSSPKK
ncbi:MAG: ADP-forming succinate--CoA ligase subunit beta [Parachlamydiales bacterium]|nr:ADP-forming succinate--CoA ligase subunit beta [Verrucomicrobiota bacterium]MBX3719026.1 ADP-forming succinate--CoA ligase subunit beta [Candidatus Acheromyda pituitae]